MGENKQHNQQNKQLYHFLTSTVGGATRSPPDAYSIACLEQVSCHQMSSQMGTMPHL